MSQLSHTIAGWLVGLDGGGGGLWYMLHISRRHPVAATKGRSGGIVDNVIKTKYV